MEHQVFPIHFPWEKNGIPVEGRQGNLKELESRKVFGYPDPDTRTMIPMTPGDVILSLQEGDPGIIPIHKMGELGILTLPLNRFRLNLPLNPIHTPTCMNQHIPALVVDTENATIFISEGNYGTVEDTVRTGNRIPRDNRIPLITFE
jgi:hypothetical protein